MHAPLPAKPPCAVLTGDAPQNLRHLPDNSVHCVVTSPPYFGLRDYGTAAWLGGDPACDHKPPDEAGKTIKPSAGQREHAGRFTSTHCWKCGAKRIDSQIGLEPSPTEYVAKLVEVFREVRRVLRPDGTLWLNLGDSYASAWVCNRRNVVGAGSMPNGKRANRPNRLVDGLKEKDLMGIPWRVAFALQADGWYLRQDLIWAKPNPMPESVRDRCTKAHEYLFLFTKSDKYYFDADAIAEPAVTAGSTIKMADGWDTGLGGHGTIHRTGREKGKTHGAVQKETRNRRSVWTISTKPYKEAHFATFPPDLVEPCVKAGCPLDGIVLDPFAGSGTVGKVAQDLNRRSVLIELNPAYVELIHKRLAQ